MKHLTTADATVRLLQLCYVLVFSLSMLVLLGGMSAMKVSAAGVDRGYLTNSQELIYIRQQAQRGVQPFAALVNNFMGSISAPTAWAYGTVGRDYSGSGGVCVSAPSDPSGTFLSQRGGAQGAYEKMIAYYLTGNLDYAIVARQKILEVTASYGFGGNLYSGGNQCVLELGWAVPLWIQAADLLEPTSIWTVNDKRIFQNWLATQIYPKVAWSSNARQNNWGASGSLAASMIGDYLSDNPLTLREVSPTARQLSPSQAVLEANANQLRRMGNGWRGDSQCSIYGIRPYGGIPDELRRGTTGCTGQWLLTNDASFTYSILQIEQLVFHAEYLSRRGNLSIYNNMASDGSGSLLKAIMFVIANPTRPSSSFAWTTSKRGVLFVANTRYRNAAISAALPYSTTVRRGSLIAFAELTHAVDIVASPQPTATATSTATLRPTNTPIPTMLASATPTQQATPFSSVGTTTMTLNPIADAYVSADTPSSNYGTTTNLRTDSSPLTRNYLRFTVPPLTGTIVSATLRVYTKSSLPLGYNVHSTNDTWLENTITFNNAPTFGPVLAISLPNAGLLWADGSLTNLVTGAGNYNFVMTTSSTTSTAFASREATNKPQLVLVVSGAVSSNTTTSLAAAPLSESAILLPTTTPMPTITVAVTSTPTAITPSPETTLLPTTTAMPSATALAPNTATAIPTVMATLPPTMMPTAIPTDLPTVVPTAIPTNTPIPTDLPTAVPTEQATQSQ